MEPAQGPSFLRQENGATVWVSRGFYMAKASAIARSNTAPVEGKESFAALLEESLHQRDSFEGTVVQGTVVGIDNDFAMIDVGLKSEGRVSLKEFAGPTGQSTLKVGDRVEVFIERLEDKNGEAM